MLYDGKGPWNVLLTDKTTDVITLKWLKFKPGRPGEDSDLKSGWHIENKHRTLCHWNCKLRFLCTLWNLTHTCICPYSLAFLNDPGWNLERNLTQTSSIKDPDFTRNCQDLFQLQVSPLEAGPEKKFHPWEDISPKTLITAHILTLVTCGRRVVLIDIGEE